MLAHRGRPKPLRSPLCVLAPPLCERLRDRFALPSSIAVPLRCAGRSGRGRQMLEIAPSCRILFKGARAIGMRRRLSDIAGWPEVARELAPTALSSDERRLYEKTWRQLRRESWFARRQYAPPDRLGGRSSTARASFTSPRTRRKLRNVVRQLQRGRPISRKGWVLFRAAGCKCWTIWLAN